MTTIDELKEVLQAEAELAEALVKVMSEKQQAIVRFEGEELARTTRREEELMKPIQDLERERIRFTSEIGANLVPRAAAVAEPLKIRDLVRYLNSREARQISGIVARLHQAVEQITNINEQNKILLKHSLHFVQETLRIVTSDHTKQLIDQRI